MCMYSAINAAFMVVKPYGNRFQYLPHSCYHASLCFTATYADAGVKLHQAEYSSELTDTKGG